MSQFGFELAPRPTPGARSSWQVRRQRVATLLPAGMAMMAAHLEAQARSRPDKSPASCPDALPAIYDRLSPAVVSIGAMSIDPSDLDHRLDRISGSGMIVDTTGLIPTNSHVVYGRRGITVTLDSGGTVPALLIGADPVFDIVMIRIPPPAPGGCPSPR